MRRKMILALMLAIVSSAWMANEASNWCMPSVRTLTQPWIEVNGTFQAEGFPCEPDEECPPCLTIVLVTSNKTYYLVTDDGQLIEYLDTIQLGTKATVSGIPFAHGSYDYIQVSHIETDRTSQLPSLCDEWNVLEISNVTCGYCEVYRTYNSHLTTDTVIGGLLYSQLIEDGKYKGALREGNNRDIYCVPAGCSQEYLLYAFNAQVGDSLKNIWVGGYSSWIPDVRSAIVSEIKQTTPRTIELEVHYYEAPDAYEESIGNLTWREGIGMPFGPMGAECSFFNGCADSKAKLLLCAYKNGEQVYVSEMGEQYGCEYNYNPYETPTDTIPLFSYTGDDPGSSTVDPVDPNQVVATLQGDQLTIHENMGVDITYSLNHEAPAQMPSQHKALQSNTFRDEVTIQITQSGEYLLQLTNPSWGYTIYGRFYYSPQGIDQIESSSLQGGDRGRLILLNGQLFILRGEKTYTLQGQEVK
jgi:hypothetical protein